MEKQLQNAEQTMESFSEGRLVINEPGGANVGIASAKSTLKPWTVYEFFINALDQCRIREIGQSSFASEKWALESLLLEHSKDLITSKEELGNPEKEASGSGIARMVRLDSNILVLLTSRKNEFFLPGRVYDISNNEWTGTSAKDKGETSVFEDNQTMTISTIIAQEGLRFVMSDSEQKTFEKNRNSAD